MASLYKRPPFWWIKGRDKTGVMVRQSLRLRTDDPAETRKARIIKSQWDRRELERPRNSEEARWGAWVRSFLEMRYLAGSQTLERYLSCWNRIETFLEEAELAYPNAIGPDFPFKYVQWREAGLPALDIRPCGRNTARLDLIVFNIIMTQAVKFGFAPSNPVKGHGIKKVESKVREEITTTDLARIWTILKDKPEWMKACFQIALYTGCRLSETRIALADVNVTERRIHFRAPKGGAVKAFTVPMREELVPLFTGLATAGKTHTLTFPLDPHKHWRTLFEGAGMPYTFHCLRVTFISIGCRSGIPESVMMKLVNHSSPTVHKIYKRFNPEELQSYLGRLQLPSLHPAR